MKSKQQVAKVFMTGSSQAIRLPKEFRVPGKEVFIQKEGDKIILSPRPISWDDFFDNPDRVSSDFLKDRNDLPPQKRELF